MDLESVGGITPEIVKGFLCPTEDFLCPISANIYNLEFISFQIRDIISQNVLFHIGSEDPYEEKTYKEDIECNVVEEEESLPNKMNALNLKENSERIVNYEFPASFLDLSTIGTEIYFKVGQNAQIKDFEMIERHYIEGKLIQSFEFTAPFCIPGSINSWEHIYSMPPLSTQEKTLIRNGRTQSDSFYFINGTLVMHNKANYIYILE